MKSVSACALVCALLFLSACRPSPEKLLATANKFHENKKYKEASILYRKVLAKDKKNTEAYYREGINLIDQGKPVEAVQYLRRAIDLKPANIDAESRLAEIYVSAYLANQQRLKSLLPQIEDLKNKILAQDANAFAGIRLAAILDAINRNTDRSIENFAKANRIQPYSRDLIGWYAQVLSQAGHMDQAETLVRDMVVHDKTWGAGYDVLFLLYRKENQPAKAESLLRSRVQNNPKSATAILNLANYLVSTSHFEEGETLMKRMLADKEAFPAAREMMGDFYARMKKFDQAVQQYQAGVTEDPKRALVYNQRVVTIYAMMGRREEALRLAQSLAAKNPKDSGINELYASLLLDTGLKADAAKSLTELKNLAKNNPTSPVLHLDLARAYSGTNDLSKALSEALEALQQETKSRAPRGAVLAPGHIIAARVYQSRGQHAQALEQTEQALKAQAGNPEARLIRDQALIGLNEVDQAVPDLTQLVETFPKLNDARLTLASVYLSEKKYPQAMDHFQRVWNSTPQDIRGFLGLQEVKMAQGKTAEAIREMEDLASKNPNLPAYRYQLANFQTIAARAAVRSDPDGAKGLLEKAADNYKQILKTSNSAEIWVRLGILQRTLDQSDAALSSFDSAIQADPRNTEALIDRGMLLDSLGKKKEAADFYGKALGVDPNNALALNNLAFLNADAGTNLDQAMTYAERAKKQAPKNADVSDTLGYVYLRKNLNAAALDIFRQDVQDQPQNATFRLHLAMALLKQGDKQGAREEAAKALKTASPVQQRQIQSFVNGIG